jgi:hypothetical protein
MDIALTLFQKLKHPDEPIVKKTPPKKRSKKK